MKNRIKSEKFKDVKVGDFIKYRFEDKGSPYVNGNYIGYCLNELLKNDYNLQEKDQTEENKKFMMETIDIWIDTNVEYPDLRDDLFIPLEKSEDSERFKDIEIIGHYDLEIGSTVVAEIRNIFFEKLPEYKL